MFVLVVAQGPVPSIIAAFLRLLVSSTYPFYTLILPFQATSHNPSIFHDLDRIRTCFLEAVQGWSVRTFSRDRELRSSLERRYTEGEAPSTVFHVIVVVAISLISCFFCLFPCMQLLSLFCLSWFCFDFFCFDCFVCFVCFVLFCFVCFVLFCFVCFVLFFLFYFFCFIVSLYLLVCICYFV